MRKIINRTKKVGNRDTLTSVAARFDTTPGELTSLNKLNSSFIYPGQQLFVPDKTASSGENINEDGSVTSGDTQTGKGTPTEDKARKLSTEEMQQEESERGKMTFAFFICIELLIFPFFSHYKLLAT